jgi:Flp pilus assembly protein TadG
MMATRRLRRLSDAKGVNLVEAAIMTPLLLLLTFGIVDFSSLFYVYLALENGVSQATRYGVTGQQMTDPNSGAPMSRSDSIIAAMRTATPTLTIPDSAFSFSHIPPGGTGWTGGVGGPGAIQRVEVSYTFTFYTPLMKPFLPPNGSVNLKTSSTMKNEGFVEGGGGE